jgi:hypothetical protein
MPGPSGGDHIFQLWKFGLPTEFANDFFGGGYEARRVAGTAWFFDSGNFFAADLFAHLDYLPHGITIAIAEIVEARMQVPSGVG